MKAPRPALQRFLEKTEPQPNGCRLWTGAIQTNGYGSFGVRKGQSALAHRWIYEQCVGPIPAGLTLDHLCRNRRCVNPEHLEPVTNAENVRRGESPTAKNARKTHCLKGHALEGDNLIQRKNGRRACKVCQRESQRKAWRKANPEVQRNRAPAPLPSAVAEVAP
jgi:hypothetical protein